MLRLICRDYGFDCDFVVDINSTDELLDKFGSHTVREHGIEYATQVLMQILLRKQNSTKFEDIYTHA